MAEGKPARAGSSRLEHARFIALFSVLFRAFPCFSWPGKSRILPAPTPGPLKEPAPAGSAFWLCLPAAAHLCTFQAERSGLKGRSWRLEEPNPEGSDQKGVFWSLLVTLLTILDTF